MSSKLRTGGSQRKCICGVKIVPSARDRRADLRKRHSNGLELGPVAKQLHFDQLTYYVGGRDMSFLNSGGVFVGDQVAFSEL